MRPMTEAANDGGLLQAKEFAERAGVTVRTLHIYDREGLLEPATRTESNYRLYGEDQLERLEQILALRFVGFGLDRIKELLAGPPRPLIGALRIQREIIAQQKRGLEAAIGAIDEAERVLAANPSADRWKTLRDVIEVFKMQRDHNWTENYYTDEDKAKIAELIKTTPPEVVEKGQRDWADLIAEVETAVANAEDPTGEHAKALAARWKGLVNAFTQGDAGLHKGLNKLWSDQTHWPKDFKRPWSDEADAFIKTAMNCNAPG
jgi:DNA-binding transcriptional MerR regulator